MSQQIKSIVAQFRQERDNGLETKLDINESNLTNGESLGDNTGNDILELVERIRRVRVVGQKRILLRIDQQYTLLLEQLKPVFGLDVTHFVNYAISDCLERNPQIKLQIRDALKNYKL